MFSFVASHVIKIIIYTHIYIFSIAIFSYSKELFAIKIEPYRIK